MIRRVKTLAGDGSGALLSREIACPCPPKKQERKTCDDFTYRSTPMARRYTGHMNGERYLANKSPSKREAHDLDNEQTRCQIDEIIRAGHDVP
jgi:hypothetical protein